MRYDEHGQNARDSRAVLHDGTPRPSGEENREAFREAQEKNAVLLAENSRLCRILGEGAVFTSVLLDPGDPHRKEPVMPRTSPYVIIRYTAPDGTPCSLTLERR